MTDKRTNESVTNVLRQIEKQFGSNTICTAKWLQGTTLLYNGTTHSCHHNPRHKINYFDVQLDYTLIHNTPEKIKERELMLEDKRPLGCEYCWKFEDQGNLSDRYYKSASQLWSVKYLDRLKTKTPVPSYLEVAFDSTCNLKCMYCSPESSSKWMEEIKRFGEYETSDKFNNLDILNKEDRIPIPQREFNPYKEAFWKWWPELSGELREFRITGGEPLMSKEVWRVIDELIEHPKEHLIFGINTNLSVESKLIDKFITKLKLLENGVDRMEVYTSCEAHGVYANYIRFGMDYDQFMSNCNKVLSQTKSTVLTFMTTINALSIFSMVDFIKDVQLLQKNYPNRVTYDLAPLSYPKFLAIQVLPRELSEPPIRDFINHIEHTGGDIDKERAGRLLGALNVRLPHIEVLRKDFAVYFTEYDKRRNVDFKRLFPQLVYLLDEYLNNKDKRPLVRASDKAKEKAQLLGIELPKRF